MLPRRAQVKIGTAGLFRKRFDVQMLADQLQMLRARGFLPPGTARARAHCNTRAANPLAVCGSV